MGLASFSKSPYDVPGPRATESLQIQAAVATSDATRTDPLWRAPVDCKIVGAFIWSTAAYTGAGTNYRSVNLQNTGAAGSGTTEVASWDGDSGNDLAANVPIALTVTSTAANALVTEGLVLQVVLEEVGTGLGLDAETFIVIVWQPS